MAAQGAMALGGIVWGTAAALLGVNHTLIGGAVLLFISLILAIPLSINFTEKLDLDPGALTNFSHRLIHLPEPQAGPVAITYEFEVDRARESQFMELMRHLRLIHLRNGAISWRLHEDLTRFNIFRIEMTVPSWTQYLLQHERMTKAEKSIVDQAKSFHVGEGPIKERIFLCVNKALQSYRGFAER
jgi:Transmembrane secretion effector